MSWIGERLAASGDQRSFNTLQINLFRFGRHALPTRRGQIAARESFRGCGVALIITLAFFGRKLQKFRRFDVEHPSQPTDYLQAYEERPLF